MLQAHGDRQGHQKDRNCLRLFVTAKTLVGKHARNECSASDRMQWTAAHLEDDIGIS